MVGHIRSRVEPAGAFAGAASGYWLQVYPLLARELRRWRAHAAAIADPELRRLALESLREERGNLEGAAAFAVLAPRAQRARVVHAVVAFQAAYDYIDTLAEQPSDDRLANGRQLHLALLTAVDPAAEHHDYYAHLPTAGDGGYLRHLLDACRGACRELPSWGSVAAPAALASGRMVGYQSLNHAAPGRPHRALTRWAVAMTPPGSALRWWETAAGAASSLSVFALIAAAAAPACSPAQAAAIHRAYFPWIGALHVLLDSLVDRAADLTGAQHSLVGHYSCPREAGSRLRAIAVRARHSAEALPGGLRHALILAAMTSFYLSARGARTPWTSTVARQVLPSMGGLAAPTMGVLLARRAAVELLEQDTRTRRYRVSPSS